MKVKRKYWLQVPLITIIRTVLNTGFRMVFPFQPFFMQGFGIGLEQMARMLAGRSFLGLFSPFLASLADSRGRKTGMLVGLSLFSIGSLAVVIHESVIAFFIFILLSLLGKSVFDPSIQAYFGDQIPYQRRGLVLALTEMSWSGAFFIGVPVVGFLLDRFGLISAFWMLSILGLIAILSVMVSIPPDPEPRQDRPSLMANFGTVLSSPAALAGLSLMVLICLGNQLVNVVFGVWLNESFAFQIAALGGASAVIGLSELIGEGGVSLISDRLSKKKAVLVGLLGSSLSAAVLPFLGRTRTGAVIGLFFFYLSFEFTIVSVIPLMTGVVPEARATLMALNIASASLGRGMGSLIAAPIYNVGFPLTAALTAGVNLLALIALRYVFVKEKG
jgi:predicted MFS family arabinose efflux permease